MIIAQERPALTAGRVIRAVVIALIAIAWLVPTVGLLVTSFRPQSDIAASGWWRVVEVPRFTDANYARVLTAQHFFTNFVNSFIITIPATILPIIIGALAAYAFSWMNFRGRNVIFLTIVALLVLPLQETWIPVLRMQSALKMTGTYLSIWLAHTAYGLPFAIFLLRNFFSELPKSLFEAAHMDGYSDFGVFWKIVLPLSVPALASLGIFQFVWVWNDLMNALVLLQDLHKFPLTVAIQNLLGSYGSEWNLLASGAFISMSIPLLVFFILQRYFVQGLTAGAVKG
ncbi:MAG TPA: carbohydrate ABC transporter permease [Spirochaetia bacterium]|nr:carbohydrate ABC transporter permease [Spirochaetia bacterium]